MVELEGIRKDFEFIEDRVEGILLFGSSVKDEVTQRSDIDICLVKPDEDDILMVVFKELGGKYDVKIFENLPLTVQMSIIKDHKVILGDEVELSFYFYQFRKRWRDNKHRIEKFSFDSTSEMIEARRKWSDEKRQISQED
ncbi:MAG: nucleotidyltransferase domain-containing protein [Candidatus Saliniplasma sp.]